MIKPKMLGKPVWVRWIDSASCTGWQCDAVLEPMTCESVGFLQSSNDIAIVLSLSATDPAYSSRPVGDLLVIPKACVTKMRMLK